MSNRQNDIIGEFSRFCIPIHCDSYIQAQWQVDRDLQRPLEILVKDTDFAIDAWARYFLLMLRQDDRNLLESVIQSLVEQAPESNRSVLAIHRQLLLRSDQPSVQELWQNSDQSRQFLAAHLQKPGWFAAKRIYNTRIVPVELIDRCSLDDCFQIVNEWANQPERLLRSFQLTRLNIRVKTYAESVLKGILNKWIQKLGVTPDSSDWSLLRYVSETELLAALRAEGQRSPDLAQAFLLWQSFKHHYTTRQEGKNPLPLPTDSQLQAISDRYENQRSRHNIPDPIRPEKILLLLHSYAETLRIYRQFDVLLQKIQQENDEQTFDPWDLLEQAEQKQEETAIVALAKVTIEERFSQQPANVQLLLQLELGLELIQADIVQLVGAQHGVQKQYQLSRCLARYKKPLLLAFIQTLQQAYPDWLPLDKSPDRLINQLQAPFEDYLVQHCQHSFYPALEAAWQHLNSNQRLLLLLHHRQRIAAEVIAKRLQTPDAAAQIATLTQTLSRGLQGWIEANFQLDLSHGRTAVDRLHSFTERWLEVQATLNREDRL